MVALLIVGAIAIGEFFIIWALLNRLLVQANVRSITIPFGHTAHTDIPEVAEKPKRKAFSIPFGEG